MITETPHRVSCSCHTRCLHAQHVRAFKTCKLIIKLTAVTSTDDVVTYMESEFAGRPCTDADERKTQDAVKVYDYG